VIALATCREVPGLLDEEGELLRDAVIARGVPCEPAVWDDDRVDWARYDLVVVRSTWDYPARRDAFLAWARSLRRVENDASTLAWTTDKHYLAELSAPTVPSAFLEPGDDPASGHPFDDVEHVVKPAVSAGSRDTLRVGPGEGADHARRLLDAGRSVLVQPYLAEVDRVGETAVVAIDGVISHAVRKGAILTAGAGLVEGLYAEEDISAREPSPAERAVAEQVLAGLARPLYARVDLLPTVDGPVVLECELAEPSLFLQYAPGAVDRLADAILRRSPT
jgi:hypothetical protein